MRRLLTWISLSMGCVSLLLVGVRLVRPEPVSTACLQLLAPTTGDSLMVDASSGASLLNARDAFPIPISADVRRAAFSPDQQFVLDIAPIAGTGFDAFNLWLRRRSTAPSHALTQQSRAYQYAWAPDSRYLAFLESPAWGEHTRLLDLALASADGRFIRREPFAEAIHNDWSGNIPALRWSPDGTMVALALYHWNVGGTFVLRSVNADQSLLVSFPDEQISYYTWSPSGHELYVFTHDVPATRHTLHIMLPDGRIRKQTTLPANFTPMFVAYGGQQDWLVWSPDGQYFLLLGRNYGDPQVEVFTPDGESVLTAPLDVSMLSLSTGMWVNQPHTLQYFQADSAGLWQTMYALDVATQQRTTIIESLPVTVNLWHAPDATAMIINGPQAGSQIALHVIARDLSRTETPFGIINSQRQITPVWSPDSQKIVLVTDDVEDTVNFSLFWRHMATGESRHVRYPKTAAADEQVFVTWLTDHLIVVLEYASTGSTLLLIDDRTMQPMPHFPHSMKAGFASILWHDDRYALISTGTSMLFYRFQDGAIMFNSPSVGGGMRAGALTAVLEPQARAWLLHRDDPNYGSPTLSLVTALNTQVVMNADVLTTPAWSSDGEMFAFAAIQTPNAGWTVNIMSRDGKLLHSFTLPSRTAATPYRQVRWTNCD